MEESLEVKLRTKWIDGRAQSRKISDREKGRKEKMRQEKVRREKMQVRYKAGKSRETVCFDILRLGKDEQLARQSGGCGATWGDERCNIASHCGAKHLWKSNCSKRLSCGQHLADEMLENPRRYGAW